MAKSNNPTFPELLKQFLASVDTTAALGLTVAHMALKQFEETGNLTWCIDLYEGLGTVKRKNLINRGGFRTWLCEYAPVKMVGGKFKKDNDRIENTDLFPIVEVRYEEAIKVDWWDTKPLDEPKDWTFDDAGSAVLHALDKFDNEKKYVPADEIKAEDARKTARLRKVITDFIAAANKELIDMGESSPTPTPVEPVVAASAGPAKEEDDKPVLSLPSQRIDEASEAA